MQVATGSYDTEGQVVFADGFLVAVLVRHSDQRDDLAGMWFLEAGFGRMTITALPCLPEARKRLFFGKRRRHPAHRRSEAERLAWTGHLLVLMALAFSALKRVR